jgi:nucleotide-binding universal stress UspA family protein
MMEQMGGDEHFVLLYRALRDFRSMRRRADIEALMARLRGRSANLLSYDDVRKKLKVSGGADRGVQDIPLDAIVGSVDRYDDFSRTFLPRRDNDAHRWARVEMATLSLTGLPPIEVYQIGQVYFVLDGNHRVSVARQLGATHIEAHITEVKTKVPLTPDIQPDELIVKARLADFLERTRLDELRPGADLSATAPGNYRFLEEQIEVQQHLLSERLGRPVSYEEAVGAWYDEVYAPVVQLIKDRGILRHFPRRTPTDLYAWIIRHKADLTKTLNWEIEPGVAALDLVTHFTASPQQMLMRIGERVLDVVMPDELEGGPSPGEWRKEHVVIQQSERLLANIFVPINDKEISWQSLDQALAVAQREGGHIYGLHVVTSPVQKESEAVDHIRTEFLRRCAAAGIVGEFAVEVGGIARKICDRSRWTDLVVVGLSHPPANQPLSRLSSGFSTLVRRCSRPLLAVPGVVSPLKKALVAYDGSPKANEALFLATYLSGHWNMGLIVVRATENSRASSDLMARTEEYVKACGVEAAFLEVAGPASQVILEMAAKHDADLIIMGGYSLNPVLEVVFGSTVDSILQARNYPVLICR